MASSEGRRQVITPTTAQAIREARPLDELAGGAPRLVDLACIVFLRRKSFTKTTTRRPFK